MSEKMALPDELLDAIVGGRMLFAGDRVTECLVDENGYTLTLETGERYFSPHAEGWRDLYLSAPEAFKNHFDTMVNDTKNFYLVETWRYEKI